MGVEAARVTANTFSPALKDRLYDDTPTPRPAIQMSPQISLGAERRWAPRREPQPPLCRRRRRGIHHRKCPGTTALMPLHWATSK